MLPFPETMEATPAGLSPRLGAGRAFAIFALVLVAQVIAALGALIVGLIVALIQGVNIENSGQLTHAMERLDAPVLLLSVAVGGAVVYLLARAWVPFWLHDRGITGFGATRLSAAQVAVVAACGLVIAAVYLLLMKFVVSPPSPAQLGPLAQLAGRGGLTRAVLTVVALLLAPPIEEVLFRGLLFKGFAESWGFVPAGITVTALFVATHLLEIVHYWPAAAAILTLAIATLAVRLRLRSVAAGIVLHAAYNGAMVLMMYFG